MKIYEKIDHRFLLTLPLLKEELKRMEIRAKENQAFERGRECAISEVLILVERHEKDMQENRSETEEYNKDEV